MFRAIIFVVLSPVLASAATADVNRTCAQIQGPDFGIHSCTQAVPDGERAHKDIQAEVNVSRVGTNVGNDASGQTTFGFRGELQTVQNTAAQDDLEKVNSAAAGSKTGLTQLPELLARVKEGVVVVSARQKINVERGKKTKDPLFEEYFGDLLDGADKPKSVTSQGPGFVIDASGLILTAAHVVDGADEIVVTLHDGTKLESTKVVGTDPKTGIALIKTKSSDRLKTLKFGDSAAVRIGDWLLAIGNSFGT